jgi:hypothetical protein
MQVQLAKEGLAHILIQNVSLPMCMYEEEAFSKLSANLQMELSLIRYDVWEVQGGIVVRFIILLAVYLETIEVNFIEKN